MAASSDLKSPFVAGMPSGVEYVLERMIVVSAYTSPDFLPALAKQLRPQSLYVVLDEATPAGTLDTIRAKVPKARLKRLSLGVAPRLMHAKLYLLTWVRRGGTNRVHRLHFGSANASEAAFLSPGNAEVLATVRLLGRHTKVLPWFEAIVDGEDAVPQAECELDGLRLHLPAFRLAEPEQTPQFDAWLQRGWLCHKYENDPAFLRLSVSLEEPLPRDEVAAAFEEAGLIEDDGRTHLRFPYLAGLPVPQEEKPPTRWRVRHFVDTILGFWTSEACFRARQKYFFKEGRARRAAEIRAIKTSTAGLQDQWVGTLMDAIRRIENRLGPRVGQWLKVKGNSVDLGTYERAARRQLGRDVAKANSRDYAERYIQGVDFLPVPNFRGEPAEWENFALSFAEVLTYQLQKGKVDNCMARTLSDADILTPDLDADDALAALRRDWPKVCQQVEAMLLGGLDQELV